MFVHCMVCNRFVIQSVVHNLGDILFLGQCNMCHIMGCEVITNILKDLTLVQKRKHFEHFTDEEITQKDKILYQSHFEKQ